MNHEELHVEVEKFEIVWTTRALLHALIDLGRIIEFKCEATLCLYPGEAFTYKNARGAKLGLSMGHIIPQRVDPHGHRPENLRIEHTGCNAAWRRGAVGSWNSGLTTPQETRDKISAAGKGKRLGRPATLGMTGKRHSEETKRKISAARRGVSV